MTEESAPHKTLKDRTKTQRTLDGHALAQVMVDAIKLAYNYTRPHMAERPQKRQV